MAKNAYDWTPLAYSQTVAAEVYFKNLVAEFERRKVEGVRADRDRKEETLRRKGAGVRLVTDDGDASIRPSAESVRSEYNTWSPVETRGSFTPTLGKSAAWGIIEGNRARAHSGE